MRFGIALGRLNPAFFVECTIEAERLGYESVWLPEHLVFTTLMSRSPPVSSGGAREREHESGADGKGHP